MAVDRREILVNALLVVTSVAVVLAGFEATLRFGMVTYTGYKWCDGPGTSNVFHPEYGWTRPPDSQYVRRLTTTDDWSVYTYNDEGFRDTYDSGTGENVIVLGDSFTEGLLVDDNATYPHLLDRWTPNASVRNYGMSGYGTAQELLVYGNVSDRYDHDLVILGYYPRNDMKNNLDSRARTPRFELRDGEVTQTHRPEREQGGLFDTAGIDAVQNALRRHVWAYRYLEVKALTLVKRLDKEGGGAPVPEGEELRRQLRLTRGLIEAVGEEAERHDAELLILVLPPREDVSPGSIDRKRVDELTRYWEIQRRMVRQVARNESNVAVLDPTSALSAAAENGARVYGENNAHMDDPGHRIVARAVYRWMTERGYVRGRAVDHSAEYARSTTTCP